MLKTESALALNRDQDVQDQTAFALADRLRGAMATELKGMRIAGGRSRGSGRRLVR